MRGSHTWLRPGQHGVPHHPIVLRRSTLYLQYLHIHLYSTTSLLTPRGLAQETVRTLNDQTYKCAFPIGYPTGMASQGDRYDIELPSDA